MAVEIECKVVKTAMDTTTRIVLCPAAHPHQKGFAASVWRTGNGYVFARGGTSYADTPQHAEQDARRWLLHTDEENATVLRCDTSRVLTDPDMCTRLLGEAAETGARSG